MGLCCLDGFGIECAAGLMRASGAVACCPGAGARIIWGGRGAKVMNRLEVKADNLQFIMVILLGLFLLPLGLFNLISGLTKGFAPARAGIGLAILALYGAVIWLVRRGHGRSVKYFSGSGLVRNDGRSFAWADLSRVVNQVRFRPEAPKTKVLWRTEIQFKGGESAWLIPAKVSNYREAREYVDN